MLPIVGLPVTYLDAEYRRFLTIGEHEEGIDQPVYSVEDYTGSTGHTSITFFAKTYGTATNGLADTNLATAGVFNAGQRYLLRAISVFFIPGVAPQKYGTGAPNTALQAASYVNDVQAVLESKAYLQLVLGQKVYINATPLTYYPAGFGLSVDSANAQGFQSSAADAALSSSHANNGFPTKGAVHQLSVPLVIPPLFQFSVTINWKTAVPTPSAVNGRLGVEFNGLLIRPIQ